MNDLGWNLALFASKWVLIGLIYAVLLVLLFSVRRELGLRLGKGLPKASAATGRLRVINPGQDPRLFVGAVLNLRADTCVGAAPDSDILLNDPFISGRHARLTWDGAAWWVEDLESRNGTFVGGNPCLSRTPQPLRPGVPLQVGDVIFELAEAER